MTRRTPRQAALSVAEGPGPVAVAGAWSVALATPYLGPLFGLAAAPGEWLEILVHLGVGFPLLGGAIAADQLAAYRHTTGTALIQKARSLILSAGIALTATHWFTAPALDEGHPTWTRLITHLMPGLIATASAAVAFARRRHARGKVRNTPPAEVD